MRINQHPEISKGSQDERCVESVKQKMTETNDTEAKVTSSTENNLNDEEERKDDTVRTEENMSDDIIADRNDIEEDVKEAAEGSGRSEEKETVEGASLDSTIKTNEKVEGAQVSDAESVENADEQKDTNEKEDDAVQEEKEKGPSDGEKIIPTDEKQENMESTEKPSADENNEKSEETATSEVEGKGPTERPKSQEVKEDKEKEQITISKEQEKDQMQIESAQEIAVVKEEKEIEQEKSIVKTEEQQANDNTAQEESTEEKVENKVQTEINVETEKNVAGDEKLAEKEEKKDIVSEVASDDPKKLEKIETEQNVVEEQQEKIEKKQNAAKDNVAKDETEVKSPDEAEKVIGNEKIEESDIAQEGEKEGTEAPTTKDNVVVDEVKDTAEGEKEKTTPTDESKESKPPREEEKTDAGDAVAAKQEENKNKIESVTEKDAEAEEKIDVGGKTDPIQEVQAKAVVTAAVEEQKKIVSEEKKQEKDSEPVTGKDAGKEKEIDAGEKTEPIQEVQAVTAAVEEQKKAVKEEKKRADAVPEVPKKTEEQEKTKEKMEVKTDEKAQEKTEAKTEEKDHIPLGLRSSLYLFTSNQKSLAVSLCSKKANQSHLFEHWPESPSATDIDKQRFITQLEEVDNAYPAGGLLGYISNAKDLLDKCKRGVNPLQGWKPRIPTGECFELGARNYSESEREGIQELGSCGFVLVAGGLGERLGYNGIKLELPTELCTETCYLQFYIETILAYQSKYAEKGRKLPLCIMTSNDTNSRTISLLKNNRYFGMDEDQITIVHQGLGVPALLDNDAKIALDPDNKYKLLVKPHGHGDIHALLHSNRVAKSWRDQGIKWITFFQDTNGLAFHTLPLVLGVSKKLGLVMNSLAVPRKAKQAIGGIAKLQREDGQSKTINVEYNQLDPLLRATAYPNGDVNDESTGYSPFPGNINQLVMELKPYVETLDRTQGAMPEFVNPKYANEEKTVFMKPTRLECMMQDFPNVLDEFLTEKVGFTQISADLCFSPVKNSTADGLKLQEAGTHPGVAASGEADQYAVHRKIMRSIGCCIEDGVDVKYNGIKVVPGPKIVFKPDFVCSHVEYEEKFINPSAVIISSNSSLVVKGKGLIIEGLALDGALIIEVEEGANGVVKDLVVSNKGWRNARIDEDEASELLRMRGYRLEKINTKKVIFKKDGSVSVTTEGYDEVPTKQTLLSGEKAKKGVKNDTGLVSTTPSEDKKVESESMADTKPKETGKKGPTEPLLDDVCDIAGGCNCLLM